jgi:hypothetical protein
MDVKSPRSMRNIALGFSRSFETWERVAVYRQLHGWHKLDLRMTAGRQSPVPRCSKDEVHDHPERAEG